MRTIQLGDSGDYVRAWQRIVGLYGSHVDGTFGPGTDIAVKAWQASHGVEPDGVIGALTRAVIPEGGIIKAYEGLRLVTYDDHDGVPLQLGAGRIWRRPDGAECLGHATIGWGRMLLPGEYITSCTRAEADQWFVARLAGTELPALSRLGIVDAGERCAAASCAYNCGTGWLTRLATAGYPHDMWMSRNKNSKGEVLVGLTMRRAEEWALRVGE